MPKKFRYSLEALLKIRKIEEEKAIQELGEIIAKVNIEKEKVRKIEEQYEREINRFGEMFQQTTYTTFYQSFQIFLNRLEYQKKELEKFIQSIQPELEEKRKKLIEVRKKLKILELLKEKRWEEYKKELKSIQQEELFELNQKTTKKKWEPLKDEPIRQDEDFDEKDESTEDLRTRREREAREFYKNRGLSGPI